MHVYIYDEYLSKKKYDFILAQIETRITDLGLSGKIIRLGIMKNILSTVENEIKRGAKAIIIVGNDQTVSKIINAVVKTEENNNWSLKIPLGIIPIGSKNNFISSALGIEEGEASCDSISARHIKKLDLGKANDSYFIANAKVSGEGTIIEMGDDYSIEIMDKGEINIINLQTNETLPENFLPNPQDGVFELLITNFSKKFLKKENKQSIFSVNNVIVSNPRKKIILDFNVELSEKVEIKILKNKIYMIVGKNRNF